jgi:hypothetical protein
MKKLVFALVLLSLIGSITTACKKKYPDDKWGSFKRPANRLSGKTWELETYLLNDQVDHTYDGTYYTQSYSELCFGGGDMKCNEGLIVVNSLIFSPGLSYNWKLSADESTFQSVEVGSAWTPTTPNKSILKLSKNHFWYVYTDEGGTKHEFRMKRKH